jgi:hypothetical protein
VTGREFSGVDLDRLADYVGGALDGTPDATEVGRLIDEDPGWRAAYVALDAAMGRVRADLTRAGAGSEPMPTDVAARLDAALRSAGGPPSVADDRAASPPPAVGGRPVRRTGPSPTDGRPSSSPAGGPRTGPAPGGPAARRPARSRRRLRWAAAVAAAAAGLAFCGLGANLLGGQGLTDSGGTAASQDGAKVAPQQGAGAPAGGLMSSAAARILASGSDYRPDTLAKLSDQLAPSAARAQPEAGGSPQAGAVPERALAKSDAAVPAELRRLTASADLTTCLATLAAGHQAPTSVQVLDYARFQGRPALVVLFTDGGGSRWAAAVGPDCGKPSAGADALRSVRVG